MQAIVLAGGLGTRLRGVVPDLPKPMAPVAGRPFLAWVLDALVDAGFERVVLAVGYRHQAIRDHFGVAYRGCRSPTRSSTGRSAPAARSGWRRSRRRASLGSCSTATPSSNSTTARCSTCTGAAANA